MVRRLGLLLAGLGLCAAGAAWAPARAAGPPALAVVNPLGPLLDVTADWQHYQPSADFCVHPTVAEVPASPATLTGGVPACQASGFSRGTAGLVERRVAAPPLCSGCHRLFIDFTRRPADGAAGHAFFRLNSLNPTFTVAPTAHSPNIKNFTNDYLVAPPGSPTSTVVATVDRFDMAYVGDTTNFAHIGIQGPYYIGPWYLNQQGQRIYGAYLDLNLNAATRLPLAGANSIVYATGYNADPATCPDALVAGPAYRDGNYLYAGCVNAFGYSALPGIDPWAP